MNPEIEVDAVIHSTDICTVRLKSFLRQIQKVLHIRFTKTVVVGLVASLVDLLCLVVLVEFLGVSKDGANVPSLIAGASIQFLGNRHVVFKSTHKKALPQIIKFTIAELASLALNALGFHLLVVYSPVPYPLIRPLVTFIVFVGFSNPLWRKVFSGL